MALLVSGVAIYVKDNLYFKEVQLKSIYDDHVWVEIRLMNGDSLLCGCIYRSPAKDRTESTKNVCDIISEAVHRNNSHLLICGDFNYPGIDWECDYVGDSPNTTAAFVETIQECYLYQHIFEPTRFRDGQVCLILYSAMKKAWFPILHISQV